MRGRTLLSLTIAVVLLAGCGGDDSAESADAETVASAEGPKLGDQCRVESAAGAQVEVKTITGPLTCEEAESILSAYYASIHAAEGSGAGLDVDTWFCISAPPPQAPRAGSCEEEETGREFEMYLVQAVPGSEPPDPEEERRALERELRRELRQAPRLPARMVPCVHDWTLGRLSTAELRRFTEHLANQHPPNVWHWRIVFHSTLACSPTIGEPAADCVMERIEPNIREKQGRRLSRADVRELEEAAVAEADNCR
jgi:hypothetical protein